jgi:hypothetical protein
MTFGSFSISRLLMATLKLARFVLKGGSGLIVETDEEEEK